MCWCRMIVAIFTHVQLSWVLDKPGSLFKFYLFGDFVTRFHWTRAPILQNNAEAIQSGMVRNLVMFGQVSKSTKGVFTPCEVCFAIHTFISHSNQPEVSSKEVCVCEQGVVENPCRSQNSLQISEFSADPRTCAKPIVTITIS